MKRATRRGGLAGFSMERRLLAGVGSTVLVLVVAVFSFAELSTFRAANRLVKHTVSVIAALHDVEKSLLDAETEQRGYFITADPADLVAYDRATAQARSGVIGLRARIAYSRPQQERLDAVERDIDEKLAVLAEGLRLHEAGDHAATVALFRSGRSQRAMDDVRRGLDEMRVIEERLLLSHGVTETQELEITTGIIGAGSIFAFLFGLAANLGIREGVLERKRDQDVIDDQTGRIAAQTEVLVANERALAQRFEELGVVNHKLDEQVHGLTVARTEAERALAALRVTSAALEKANRDLDQFAYAASHDLKAPLRGIATLSDWLEEDLAPVLTSKAKEQLRLLHGRVLRMEALIDGILAYSRASRGKVTLESIEVARFLRDVVELVSPAPGVITIDVPDSMPPLLVQVAPFQQVWMNLIGNAVKHGAREGAVIRLASQDAGDVWEFSVSDNGPGIEGRYHERIFRIFQTLASRDKVEGTGIGLAIVKKLVEDRGGRVWVESEPGKGARFCFTWPKS
jgi:signal transduction histidine kinase